ncbi:phosphatidate cytidylyltransferase [candidate division WOR-3 bacterium]|nr:phosphatidate cytidylyltransferase [candidate division WOR-3 bacterium]
MAASTDLKRRTITGFFLGSAAIGCILIDHIVLPLMIIFFITFATNEFFRFLHRKNIYPHTLAVLLPGYAIPLLVFYHVPLLLPFAILFFFVCFLSVLRYPGARQNPNFLAETTAAVFAILYLSFLPSTLILLREIGFWYAIAPLALTWAYDTAAFLTGSLVGKHKLARVISPKKTWEGTLLGFPLLLPITYLAGKAWLPSFDLLDVLLVTIGIGIMATIGDIFESGMKREVGLKDASKVFPGHGGFLDRMDSLLFTIPFFYLYLILLQ